MKSEIRRRAQNIKLVLMDCDGVLTDGRVWLTADGDEQKAFHVRDGLGIARLQETGLAAGIISGRSSTATERRASELNISYLRQGVKDKVAALEEILKQADVKAEECAYLGDDLADIGVMKRVGLAIAVADAAEQTKQVAHYVTKARGGRGAVREACELTLTAQVESKKKRSLESRFEELWGALALPIFAALILRFLLQALSLVHWSLAMITATLLVAVIVWLLLALARWAPTRHPVHVTLSLFGLVVFVGAAICSHLSYFVYSRRPAAYLANSQLNIGRFFDFYIWYFIDMIPLKIWETLRIDAPVKVMSRLGAAPLLLFRIVVATPVLTLVVKWYKSRWRSD